MMAGVGMPTSPKDSKKTSAHNMKIFKKVIEAEAVKIPVGKKMS